MVGRHSYYKRIKIDVVEGLQTLHSQGVFGLRSHVLHYIPFDTKRFAPSLFMRAEKEGNTLPIPVSRKIQLTAIQG